MKQTADRRYENYDLWNERVSVHYESQFYGVKEFKQGATSLTHIELQALGDVQGKSMLHLQCHFGLDTLSWARRGAKVVGVDYSADAIKTARQLAEEIRVDAKFVRSCIYELGSHLREQFDIVFTSYGVLKWLPDIEKWGETVASYLKPGGTFFIVEFHPFLYVFDYERAEKVEHSYFFTESGITYTEKGSYAAQDDPTVLQARAWMHPVSSVLTSLIRAGLSIREFREYPYSTLNCFPFVKKVAAERYTHSSWPGMLPMLYSISATR